MPTRTYLEQKHSSDLRPALSPGEEAAVVRVDDCEPSLWRQLYTEVGQAYYWVDRLGWTDEDIRTYLSDPAVSLWVLSVHGGVAGYFELRKHPDPEVRLEEVRLKPDATGESDEDPESPDLSVVSGCSRTFSEDPPVASGFSRTFSVEIAYFGLLPAYVGRGLGKYLLSEAAARAWDLRPSRVWLHTSTLDHAAALPNYLARGFSVFRVEQH